MYDLVVIGIGVAERSSVSPASPLGHSCKDMASRVSLMEQQRQRRTVLCTDYRSVWTVIAV